MAETKFLEEFNKLNPEQRRAVETIEGPVLVEAGPGTGKTQLLAMRVANIVRQTQMEPSNVLCLTFTESGVAAMRDRLASIMGSAGYQVRVHTFHSLCNDVILEWPEKFAFARELKPLSEIDRAEIFEMILEDLPTTSALKPFGSPQMFAKDIQSAIGKLKQEAISPQDFKSKIRDVELLLSQKREIVNDFKNIKANERDFSDVEDLVSKLGESWLTGWLNEAVENLDEKRLLVEGKRETQKLLTAFKNELVKWWDKLDRGSIKQKELLKVYGRYQRELLARGRYDFEDMIAFVNKKWEEDDELLAYYQEQLQYVLVDEYQDTNGVQNQLLFKLVSYFEEPNVCVVGDSKQAIYRFQGASEKNQREFQERFSQSLETIVLQENYRSTENILKTARGLFPNTNELVARSESENKPVSLKEYPQTALEMSGLVKQVSVWLEQGVEAKEIAILCRKNREAEEVARNLERTKIDVKLASGINALEEPVVQKWLELIRYLVGEVSEAGLARIIQYREWKVEDEACITALLKARRDRQSLHQVVAESEALADIWTTLSEGQKSVSEKTIRDFMAEVLWSSGLAAEPVNLPALAAVFNWTREVVADNPKILAEELLARIDSLQAHNLKIETDVVEEGKNAVNVMTAHKSKGLEFERVWVYGAIEKSWGGAGKRVAVSLPEGLVTGARSNAIDDDRRLLYVAITRAKKEAVISWSSHNSAGKPNNASMLVDELDDEGYERENIETVSNDELESSWQLAIAPIISADDKKARDLITGRINDLVLSVTHVNNFYECPRKFYYQNLLQMPAVKTRSLALGTATHAALRDMFADQSFSKKELVQSFVKYLKIEALSENDEKDSLEMGSRFLRDWFSSYKNIWSEVAAVEYSFEHHGVRVGQKQVPITGILDKIEWQDKSNQLVSVVDYKTGRPENAFSKLKVGGDYWRQIVFYKLLCENSSRFKWKMDRGEFDFIQPDRKGKFVKKTIEVGKQDEDQVISDIEEMWESLESLDFLDRATCGECEYCQAGW